MSPISRPHLISFEWRAEARPVNFVETTEVNIGVNCDIYEFSADGSCDLAIVTVDAGCKTPLQRIVQGEQTIEGYRSGTGTLQVRRADGQEQSFNFPSDAAGEVKLGFGDVMQWQAAPDSELVFYEICTPPYEEGRFENITE